MDKAQHAEGLHRPGEAQQAPSKQPPRHFDLNEAAGSTDIGVDGSVAADGAKPPFSGPASSHGLKQGDAAQAGPKAPPTQVRHVGQAAPGGQWKTANGHNGVNGRAATGAKAERASAVPVAGGTQPRPAFRVSPPDPEVVDIDTDSEDGSETEEDAEDYTESETGSEAEEQEHARAPRSAALLGGDRVQQRGSQGIPMQVGPSFPEADEGQRRGSNRFKAPSVHDDSDDPDDCVILGEIRSSATVPPPAAASGSAAVGGAGPGLGGSGARGAAWPGAGRGGDTGRHDNWWTAAGPSGRTDVNDEGQSPLKNGPEQRVPKSPGPTLSTPGQESGPGRGATGEDESSDVEILDGPQKSKEWEAAKQTKRKHREERAPPQPGAHAEGAAGGLANGAVHEGGASAFKRGRTEVPGATPGPSSPGLRTGGDKFSFSQVVRERAAAGAKEGGSGPQGKGEGGQKRKADEEGDRRQKQQKVPPLADLRARVHGGPSAAAQAGGKGNARGPTVMTGLFSSGGAGLRPLIPKGSQAPSSANGWKKRPVGQEAGKSERGAAPAARDAAPVGPRATAKREEGEGMPASTSVSRVAEPAAPRQEDGAGGRDQEVPQSVGPAREGTENSGRNTMERTDNAVSEVAERANAEAGASVNSEDGDGRSALEKGGEHKDPHQSEAGPLDTGALEAELREGEQDGAGTPVVLREALKESEEFRSADAAEWEQRQAAIDKQNEEAAALKRTLKRKRADQERQLETEQRQKQRLDELRTQQAQEESRSADRERLRGRIRADLERKSRGAHDMAALLRALGIPVDGGLRPSAQQVNAAYKKALLRFHPDRVNSSAPGDVQKQVEAEETFKVISKLKEKLSAAPKLPAFYGFASGSGHY